MCNSGPDSTKPPGPAPDSAPPRQWHQATVAQPGAVRPPPAIMIVESATAEGVREAAEGVETPGSYQAAQLRVAEQYVEKLGLLAKENDTMILPITVGDPSSIIAERRTPYDRGRDPSRAGERRVPQPLLQGRSVHLFRPLWSTTCPGNGFPLPSSPPGRGSSSRAKASRRTASSGSGRYSVCSTQMFTYGPSRNGSLLCTCPYRFTVASGTSFIAICVTTLTRAFGQVEHQAVVAPGIRMGDVAHQADDGVAGADTASPVPEQVPVHLLDAPERPTPAQQHRGVRQMQVRPKPGPFRCAGDDRDVGVGRQVHQQLDEDVLQDGIQGRFSPAQSLEVDPGVNGRPKERHSGQDVDHNM